MTEEESIEIIRVQDILADARSCVECVWLTAMNLHGDERDAIRTVADIASKKIKDAGAFLEGHRIANGFGPELPAPGENA
jgi:hypothetical protein